MARNLTREERINDFALGQRVKYPNDYRSSTAYCEAFVDGMIAVENIYKRTSVNHDQINKKFEYCGYTEGTSDKEFLSWIYARLNAVFGEPMSLDYMQRLEKIIDGMKDKYVFFPHPDAGKDNVGVKEQDVLRTLREYGFVVNRKR